MREADRTEPTGAWAPEGADSGLGTRRVLAIGAGLAFAGLVLAARRRR